MITIARMKPTAKALRGCEAQLERIADCLELLLSEQGIRVRKRTPDTSGDEPEVYYTDDERDAIRELQERFKGIEQEE